MRRVHTAEVVLHDVTVPAGACSVARTLDERIARAREVTTGIRLPQRRPSRRPGLPSLPGGRHRACRVRVRLEFAKQRKTSGVRSSSVRPLRSSLPT